LAAPGFGAWNTGLSGSSFVKVNQESENKN